MNATERAVRGETRTPKLDGIYRAMRDPKRHSTHMQRRVAEVANGLRWGQSKTEPGKASLLATRGEVERGWHAVPYRTRSHSLEICRPYASAADRAGTDRGAAASISARASHGRSTAAGSLKPQMFPPAGATLR